MLWWPVFWLNFADKNRLTRFVFPRHDLRDGMAKIAEATYSEVFSAPLPTTRKLARGVDRPKLVVKILPFCAYEGADIDPETGERTLVNGCGQLEPSAIWTEVACSRRMASVGSGLFGGFLEARIAKGPYLAELHREWCRWDSDRRRRGLNPSDNWEPDYFHENQHYLLLFLPFGGIDLDSFALPSWTAAHSAFWQVTLALAAAEREASFEHRDLHAGNVLLMEGTTEEQIGWTDPKSGKRYEFSAKQVRATVIDYTLARFESEGRLFYNPLDDEELFKGQGDRQYDVYRSMRKVSCGEWRGYWPRTNVLVGCSIFFRFLGLSLTNGRQFSDLPVAGISALQDPQGKGRREKGQEEESRRRGRELSGSPGIFTERWWYRCLHKCFRGY